MVAKARASAAEEGPARSGLEAAEAGAGDVTGIWIPEREAESVRSADMRKKRKGWEGGSQIEARPPLIGN